MIMQETIQKAHTEHLHKEYNILKVQNMYQLAILKFYCKLVNNNLPQYFNAFSPKFSVLTIIYEIRRDNYRLSDMNFLGNL